MAINDLSLRQLQYAVAVADTLGFRRAAERCAVSQPTLSAQVQQLEEVLGVKLFERDRRRVLLTPAGEDVVGRARRVLVETEDLLAAATRSRDPYRGTFRVGVIPTIAPYLLPEVSRVMAARFPALRLVYREEKTHEVVRDLRAGALDAALVALPRGHRLTLRKRLTLDDLESEQVLLLDDGHCLRAQALALCARGGAREADLRATSLATLVQMVAAGGAVTLLPELALAVENRGDQLEVRPLGAPAPSRTIVLAWRPRSPFAAAFRRIAAALRAG